MAFLGPLVFSMFSPRPASSPHTISILFFRRKIKCQFRHQTSQNKSTKSGSEPSVPVQTSTLETQQVANERADQCEGCSTDTATIPHRVLWQIPQLLKGEQPSIGGWHVRTRNTTTKATPIAHQIWTGFCPRELAVLSTLCRCLATKSWCPRGVPRTLMSWSAVGMSDPLPPLPAGELWRFSPTHHMQEV